MTDRQFCRRTRREFLWEIGGGFGSVALTGLLSADGFFNRASAAEKTQIRDALWVDGHLNRKLIAKDADIVAHEIGLPAEAAKARFFMVEETGIGPDHPFSGEKLSLVLTGRWPMSCVNPSVLGASGLKRWQPVSMERGPNS